MTRREHALKQLAILIRKPHQPAYLFKYGDDFARAERVVTGTALHPQPEDYALIDEATVFMAALDRQEATALQGIPVMYIVHGTVGSYSDRKEWTVVAYGDRAMAERHADLAMEASVKRNKQQTAFDARESSDERDLPNPYDPFDETDYEPADYYVQWVTVMASLEAAPDEFLRVSAAVKKLRES